MIVPAHGQEVPIQERIDRNSIPEPNSGCHLWTGGYDNRGWPFKDYGRIWVKGRTIAAHRVAWEAVNGPIPDGMCVCHKCDTPRCVNPEHLFLGTHKENTRDMINKGRNAPIRERHMGEKSHHAKLTEAQVLAIRRDSRVQQVIADEYGVSQTAISQIKLRKNWGWLNG